MEREVFQLLITDSKLSSLRIRTFIVVSFTLFSTLLQNCFRLCLVLLFSPYISSICVKYKQPIIIITQLWHPARQGGKGPLQEEDKERADKCVFSEITRHHKAINPARRDGEELGMVENQNQRKRENC